MRKARDMTAWWTTDQLRAAGNLRRVEAETARHDHGDIAFMAYRSAVPGREPVRKLRGVFDSPLKAEAEMRGHKELIHTTGYFTRYERRYPMWDDFGMYRERVRRGAGARTLAAKPEVAFLTNHTGMAMARTTAGTLDLREDPEGGWHDGWLNKERSDINDLIIAIKDKHVPQMSFAFLIPDGKGEWSADFTDFEIIEYDIDGGDVSACNYGANPFTDISVEAEEALEALSRLPLGAQREALARLTRTTGRERTTVSVRLSVDPKASAGLRRLQGRTIRTGERLVAYAEQHGLSVADLVGVQLPWYEIRAASPSPDPAEDGTITELEPEATDVFIFDEIGGSFGVSAEKFARELNAITTPEIRLRINSPGGSVTDGFALHSALLHHPSHITSYVDGIAASAASYVALGADEIVTMEGAQWMMHDASMMTEGNKRDHAKGSTHLARQDENIADTYAKRMGITREEALAMMDEETWAFAAESVEMGIADRVGTRADVRAPEDMQERMTRKHDLTRFGYRYTCRADAPAPGRRQFRAAAPPPGGEKTAPQVRMGRSISLIEARLDQEK